MTLMGLVVVLTRTLTVDFHDTKSSNGLDRVSLVMDLNY